MSAERIWANSAVAGLVLVAALLIVPGLGVRYLWDDEAETALLAKNVIRFGVPVAWDGASLISQECGSDYDANYLWLQTPWLPIYLTAASLSIFAAIWFLYFFFTLPRSPRLAAAGLALSLTVLVHTSQLLFFGAVAGLALGFLIVSFDREVLPWVLTGLIAPSIVNLPWLVR